MIKRIQDILRGPDALQPWTLPAMPAPLVDLLPWRAWDEAGEFYVNAASCGFVLELPPFAGIDEGTLDALAGTLADSAPERSVVQVIHWTSPRYGAAIRDWAQPREGAGGLQAVMAARREALFSGAGWRPLHAGGPPFTLNDCRVFLTACLPGRPGPAAETALGVSAVRSKARSPRSGPGREGSSRTGCYHSRRNSRRPTRKEFTTAGLSDPRGAGRPATRSTCSALRPAAR